MSAYLGSTKVWNSNEPDENGWTRPADWLPMPVVEATEEKIVGLHAVWPTDGNFASVRLLGACTIDWGDGAVENFASSAQADHVYDYDDPQLDGTLTSAGYKQAIVTITPQSGQNITAYYHAKHAQSGLANYSSGWLDLVFSVPNCVVLSVSSANFANARLQRFKLLSCAATNLNYIFTGCSSLQSIDLRGVGSNAITSIQSICASNSSLKYVDLSYMNALSMSNISGAFNGCTSLETVKLPTFDNALTDVSTCFYLSWAIKSLDLSCMSGAAISNTTSMFALCRGLAKINFPCPVNFSIADCHLSAAALDALYTSLPTVTAKTIFVKGNYGISGHTPSIATAKGWTVDTTT